MPGYALEAAMSVRRRCSGAREWKLTSRRLLSALLALMAMMVFSQLALADSFRGFAALQHTAWSLDQGAPPAITAIARTPDGYLWLGGSTGLYRFDGVSFEAIGGSPSDRPHSDHVFSLLVTHSGELWVGYRLGGAAVLRHGVLQPLALDHSAAGVAQMVQDPGGAVWIRREQVQHRLLRCADERCDIIGADWGLENETIGSLFLAGDGVLWLTNKTSVQFLRRGAHRFEHTGEQIDGGTATLFEDQGGRIWVVDTQGARRLPDYLRGAHAAAPQSTPADDSFRPYEALISSDGAFWGTDGSHGVFRFDLVHSGSGPVARRDMESFGAKDGLTSASARSLFQDREGNIWIGTLEGLDQFRPKSIITETLLSAPAGSFFSTAVDDEGIVYVSSLTGTFTITPHGGPQPILSDISGAYDICKGNEGGIWVITDHEVVKWQNGSELHFPPTGADMDDIGGCAEDKNGDLWNTAGPFGLQRMSHGRWSQVSLGTQVNPGTQVSLAAIDHSGGRISNVEPDPEGGVSFLLTDRGIMSLKDGHLGVLASFKDMGIGTVHGVSRQGRDLLVSGQYGLARIRGGTVKSLHSDRYGWLRATEGIVETMQGNTWIFSSAGLFVLPTTELDAALDPPGRDLNPRRFDSTDGLPAWTGRFGSEHVVVEGGDRRIWIDAGAHMVSVDPAHLPYNPLPPPVQITSVTVDGRRYMGGGEITLPRGVSNLQISYTALCLTIPGRVHFKYRLVGYNGDWIEAGGRREAFYTNLPPARYQFQVIAANNDGVWNDHSVRLTVTIPPTFLQSR
jgi:ligand-binding sensor domain-containing protein